MSETSRFLRTECHSLPRPPTERGCGPSADSFGKHRECAGSSHFWKTDLQFNADGDKLVSCERPHRAHVGDRDATFMKQWDTDTGTSRTIVAQGVYGRCDLAVVPGTDHLLCGGLGSLAIKRRESGELIRLLDDDPVHEYQQIAVSPDAKWAAGSGHILESPRQIEYFAVKPTGNVCFVTIVNLESGQRDFYPLPAQADTWIINSLVFSPNSEFLVTGGGDSFAFSRVDIFELSSDRFRHAETRESPHFAGDMHSEVKDVAFSADSRLVGTVEQAGIARIWSLRGPQWDVALRRKNGLYSLAFSPDGRILALGDSSGIQLCDLRSQFPLATIPVTGGPRSLQFSPNGRTLALAFRDGQVKFLRTSRSEPSN